MLIQSIDAVIDVVKFRWIFEVEVVCEKSLSTVSLLPTRGKCCHIMIEKRGTLKTLKEK